MAEAREVELRGCRFRVRVQYVPEMDRTEITLLPLKGERFGGSRGKAMTLRGDLRQLADLFAELPMLGVFDAEDGRPIR